MAGTPAVVIPDVVATHVVAKSEVELGKGNLTLLLDSQVLAKATELHEEGPGEPHSQPVVMTLTVGAAAFPIFATTDFGTWEGDERVYVFSPEVGKRVGYVKITLPDGVREEGSELADLQEQFEKILVDRNILKESGVEP